MRRYIDKPDPYLDAVIHAAYPRWKGKKVQVNTDTPPAMFSYWEGGSKDHWVVVELTPRPRFIGMIPQNGTMFDKTPTPRPNAPVPEGVAIVQHCLFRGKDLGVTVWVNEANVTSMLPAGEAAVELTRDQKVVLMLTCGLKSAYRREEAEYHFGMSSERWYEVAEELKKKALLTKGGGITAAGRNAAQGLSVERTR